MLISIDAEKALNQIQHPFMILKNPQPTRIGGKVLNIIKCITKSLQLTSYLMMKN